MKKLNILFLFLIPALIYSQSAKETLLSFQNKYKTVKSFTADFAQETKSNLNKDTYKNSGKIYFEKINKFRIEFQGQLLITDGTSVWNYNKKQNKVVITNYNSEPSVFSLDKYILDYPKDCEATYFNQAQKILLLKPKKKGMDFKDIKIYTSNSQIMSRIEFTDANGNYYSFEFSNVKLNEKINGQQFTFITPKGVRSVDLR